MRLAIAALVLAAGALPIHAEPTRGEQEHRFFAALEAVEGAQGNRDHGRAHGVLQIHHGYWSDAVEQCPDLRVDHWQAWVSHRAYARLVVAAYMRRHAPVAWKRGDWATCAAIHNAGVRGVAKGRGKAYARRVIALMTAEKGPA